MLIAGFLYIADFDSMLQYRRNDPCRRRRIKRDLATTTSKGVAGLKTSKDSQLNSTSTPDLVSNVLIPDLQSLHISSRPVQNHLHDTNRSMSTNSPSLSSQQNLESSHQNDSIRINRPTSLVLTDSTCNAPSVLSSNLQSSSSSDLVSPRNIELDNVIHDTLDWTIEQIEALNLELSNDFENLFRNVNSLGPVNSTNANNTNRSNVVSSENINIVSNDLLDSSLEINSQSSSRLLSQHSTNYSDRNSSTYFSQFNQNNEISLPRNTVRIPVRSSTLTNSDLSQTVSRSRGTSKSGCKRISSNQL